MNQLMDLLELLNKCSPERATAYMFFIVIVTYLLINTTFQGLTNIVFVLAGYSKSKKNKDEKTTE